MLVEGRGVGRGQGIPVRQTLSNGVALIPLQEFKTIDYE
ncbi:hypothetical protein Pcinc_028344, partial [Petrolisthes cinctipes]